MKRVSIAGILAAGLIATPAASGWDHVYDFEAFPLGTIKGDDSGAPITELWKVSRDEGFEAGRTSGFMHLTIAEAPDGQKIFSAHSAESGWGAGQTFSGFNFDLPITDQGTIYFQIMTEGISFDFHIGVTDRAFVAVDPAPDTNPWGYRAEPLLPGGEPTAHAWGDLKTVMRNMGGMIGIRDGGMFRHGEFAWVPGAWYEVWQTVDIASQLYTVWLRSPDAEIWEQIPLAVEIDDADYDHYYFRTPVDDLRALLLGKAIGSPENHRVFLNAIAVDLNEHNLTNPGVEPPAIVIEYLLWYGFIGLRGKLGPQMWADAGFFLGSEVWFGRSPYIWIEDILRWAYVPSLWIAPVIDPETGEETAPGQVRDHETYNLSARAAEWVYIWENPFAPNEWNASLELMTWVWSTDSGWVYVVNSRN